MVRLVVIINFKWFSLHVKILTKTTFELTHLFAHVEVFVVNFYYVILADFYIVRIVLLLNSIL